MKDITISGRRIRTELLILLGCFAAAVCTNIFAIIKYSRPVKEVFTMIGFTVFITLGYYFILLVLRLAVAGTAALVRKLGRSGK